MDPLIQVDIASRQQPKVRPCQYHTRKKKLRRMIDMAPQSACGSRRYAQQHPGSAPGGLPAMTRAEVRAFNRLAMAKASRSRNRP